ncbi:MAG TPA: hypothetical protein DCS33_09625 [Gammaproteobacteria bacterium]|nr:hypothetical protein [Gammaproteobacteria bacterium]
MFLVNLDDACIMHHLYYQHDMIGALHDLHIVVIHAAQKRRARGKRLQTAIRQGSALGAVAAAQRCREVIDSLCQLPSGGRGLFLERYLAIGRVYNDGGSILAVNACQCIADAKVGRVVSAYVGIIVPSIGAEVLIVIENLIRRFQRAQHGGCVNFQPGRLILIWPLQAGAGFIAPNTL